MSERICILAGAAEGLLHGLGTVPRARAGLGNAVAGVRVTSSATSQVRRIRSEEWKEQDEALGTWVRSTPDVCKTGAAATPSAA